MLLRGEDTESKPKDTDTASLSSAVVEHAQVSAVSNRPCSFIIEEFDVSSKLERKAIFSARLYRLSCTLVARATHKTTLSMRKTAYPMRLWSYLSVERKFRSAVDVGRYKEGTSR